MAFQINPLLAAFFLFLSLAKIFPLNVVTASDPDPVEDICIPNGRSSLSQSFVFSQAIVSTFPGLNTMGFSVARIYLGPGGVVRSHAHPRASELVDVEKGVIEVGFVDSSNKLFAHNLKEAVVPRGMLHYIMNVGATQGVDLGFLNSQNPAFQIPSFALFGPKLPYEVLEASFILNRTTIDALHEIYKEFV
ncbi:hypothetical protein SELMODRAFT_411975 [Selaginella moellendorffii]|uniref:Germin-like protein n=1 Tax=Selaginella moellendorffii TaxID=88036 RepID=D8RJM6_SELML|nr:hypothetical protein SELMODRAFT_411975 [Selaginella moellendorffii]